MLKKTRELNFDQKKEQEEVNTARSQGLNSQLQAERQAVNEKYKLMREDVDNRCKDRRSFKTKRQNQSCNLKCN